MAQTGTTFTLQSSAYQGRYLKLTCTSSQDIANNKTNISWKLESIGGSSGHYATIVRVNINGSEVYSIDKGYTYNAFPVTKGSTTGSTSVTMGSDGNKSITIYMDAAIYTSSTTRYSDTWTLNTVPRYPTISSFSVNKISGSSTSLSFVWSASAPGGNISKLEYSTDNGTTFKTASSVTSPLTVSGLASAKGYNCKIRVTSSASGLTATTQTPVYQTTYQQPTANISTANISGYNGLSQIKVSWSSNMDIAKVEYSKDNGSTWYNAGDPNASSGNYTYTGLTEGQYYNFRVRVTATTGSCVTTSGASSRAPYKRVSGKLFVNGTQVATNNGQTGVALKNGDTLKIDGISNGANCGYKLFFENPDNQHQYLSAKTTGTTAISMTAAQINERLQYFKNDPSQGFNVGLTTLNGSDQPALYYEFFGTISAVNVNPTFDENRWTYQDTNATTVALTGSNQVLVNGFSKLRVSVNTAASGNGYATIKQYAVSGCTSGSSSTTGNIDCPNATNGGTIKVTAKDSRNNVTETTKTATYKDYFVPTLTNISATRNNGGVGTQTSMTFNGTWWNNNFGASANTLTAVYRYKSGSSWSDPRAITLTTSGNTYSFNTSQLYGDLNADGFTLGTTFAIEVTITDALNGGKSWTTVLNSGTPAIAISGNNIAVGAQYDTSLGGKLQVHGDIRATGNISAENYKTISLSGGSGNTQGYRCFAAFTATMWGNYRAVMIVRSRHSGNGLLSVGVSFGSTASTLSGTPSFTIDGNVTQFGGGDAWVMRVDGSKVELWWKYYDYNDTTITILSSNFNIVSGGTWQTSLPSGGTKYYACNSAYPIGAIYLSWDSTSPATLFGGTWERVGQGGFLYSCVNSPGTGNGTGTSTGGSSAANTGKSSGSTGKPSTNSTGGVTLTAAQSGLRQHKHTITGNYAKDVSKQNIWGSPIWNNSDGSWCGQYSGVTVNDVAAANATGSHSHTLSNHTHSLNDHTHSMAHTHGVPYVAIYMWKRTA